MLPNRNSPAIRSRSGAISQADGVEPPVSVPPPNLVRVSIHFCQRSSNVVISVLQCCYALLTNSLGIVLAHMSHANQPCDTLLANLIFMKFRSILNSNVR